jgi:hypothetical protein
MILLIQDIITQASTDGLKWTDIVSALSAAIGIPLVVGTLYKLMKKDKERESEIQSLSVIATKLTDIQRENEIRYKASKKPYFDINLQQGESGNRLKLDFTNLNLNATLINFDITNSIDFGNINYTKSTINNIGGKENFFIILNGKESPIEHIILHLEYNTEENYAFIQNLIIWRDQQNYNISPSPITNKEINELE